MWLLISSSKTSVISLSNTACNILSSSWKTVTFFPFCLAASTASSPMNPAPIITTSVSYTHLLAILESKNNK